MFPALTLTLYHNISIKKQTQIAGLEQITIERFLHYYAN